MNAKIAVDKPGSFLLLNGDEAVARGAIEAGVKVAASYPGTPSTEILETIADVAKNFGIYAEWSINEIVALEVAAGASMVGARAIVSMKHVGLNVAADAAMTLAYMVLLVGWSLPSVMIRRCIVARTNKTRDILLCTRIFLCWMRAPLKKP